MGTKIILMLYPDGSRYRAFNELDGTAGEAWPVRRFTENGQDCLEAVVVLPGIAGTQTYRFAWDRSTGNWSADGAPIAKVAEIDLLV